MTKKIPAHRAETSPRAGGAHKIEQAPKHKGTRQAASVKPAPPAPSTPPAE
ncbi:hypothetical protein [Novosphingobium mangrovi (ex Huang et al. 2023)]|uniref:Uncharacterized protein n=1 Tax=Novosphingobium mangrovi (ex Huang et al. 2023) TaxID=2976432 RepID=A0ABT2I141_9SPHN|nr:hypothetical protein [Novosphingobium mangrovi (ex Huang et al. 2023)]MCT2398527.1 hypothetical protein [Novosphingobium mangrovi (ex Huang et al. 2023)]